MSKKTFISQLKWLKQNIPEDKKEETKHLLSVIENDWEKNKWSKLSGKDEQALWSLVNEETTTHANGVFEKYFGTKLPSGFHELGLWYQDQFANVYLEESEELDAEVYGYLDLEDAFDETYPSALVRLLKFRGKYVVVVEDDDYIEDVQIFNAEEEARQYFETKIGAGLKEGKELIADCLADVVEGDNVEVQPENSVWGITFSVYYGGKLLIEHMRELTPLNKINEAIEEYHQFCKEHNITIMGIEKYRPYNSNQRYYVVTVFDETSQDWKEVFVHIPSKWQGRERTTISLITKNNIVSEMQ